MDLQQVNIKKYLDNVRFMSNCHTSFSSTMELPMGESPPGYRTPTDDGKPSGRSSPRTSVDWSVDTEVCEERPTRIREEPSQGSSQEPSRESSAKAYLSSQKGRELVMGISLMLGVTVIVAGLTIHFSHYLSDVIVGDRDVWIFVAVLFAVSGVGLLVILVLGHLGYLTTDDHYKDQRRTAYLRGGMTVLATGGIVYYACEMIMLIQSCGLSLPVSKAALAIIFIMLQVAFLLRYSKIRINKNLCVVTASRFMLMFIIATNGVVWLGALIEETIEELHKHDIMPHAIEDTKTPAAPENVILVASQDSGNTTECDTELNHLISPFLFPLLIEFCVVASTMALAIWEKCGIGLEMLRMADMEVANTQYQGGPHRPSVATSVNLECTNSPSEAGADDAMYKRSGFYNGNIGLVCGWISVVIAMVAIILVLYQIYNDRAFDDEIATLVYGTNMLFTLMGALAIPCAVRKMSRLRFKDEEIRRVRKGERSMVKKPRLHRDMDRNLLTVTFLALLTYKMMSIVVAAYCGCALVLADAIISIIHGFMQTIFLNWYACHKRAKTQQTRAEKPGRQFLEFLRLLNISLWLANTFLLKLNESKGPHEDTFGLLAWIIISNILQPLTILYHFHSTVCIAEVIQRSYTEKYVGIPRPNKQEHFSVARNSVVYFGVNEKTLDRTKSGSSHI